ncbi:hypothetical protein E6H30_03375 [Candidatus Bathyarchaeota archaeon]|nr:MAG: hypothetical protein E6H30_03375 [Candidatus Bathyarchaeota archaeon]
MKDTRNRVADSYKWTAFLKLKGQTSLRNEEEILDEFDGFVQSLQRVGVDYNIIVMVEGKAPRQLHSPYNIRETEPTVARKGSGA